jgi:hypothetical protein
LVILPLISAALANDAANNRRAANRTRKVSPV